VRSRLQSFLCHGRDSGSPNSAAHLTYPANLYSLPLPVTDLGQVHLGASVFSLRGHCAKLDIALIEDAEAPTASPG